MNAPSSIPTGSELPRIATSIPGPRAVELCEILAAAECPALTTRRARREEQTGSSHDPIVWEAARGSNVLDVDGNVYIDMTAGFGAALVGYGHPRIVEAVRTQAERLMHALGDVYPSEPKIRLEQRLAALAPWDHARVILGLSGSDAVEAALKTAMLATEKPGILAFEGGYHGLSHGPLAACGYHVGFRAPFHAQLNPHVWFATYPAQGRPESIDASLKAVRKALARGDVGAILIEPILGRGGVIEADRDALGELGAMARSHGALIIADEMYTGMRRAGHSECFTREFWPFPPDLVCLGKALGGTLPVSACLMRPEIASAWGSPSGEAIHTSTFLGNPLACAAALAHLDVLAEPATQTKIDSTSDALTRIALAPLLTDSALGVTGLGGRGLLLGVHLAGGTTRALAVMRALLERGYIALVGGHQSSFTGLALTPPMTLSTAQIEGFALALRDSLRECRA